MSALCPEHSVWHMVHAHYSCFSLYLTLSASLAVSSSSLNVLTLEGQVSVFGLLLVLSYSHSLGDLFWSQGCKDHLYSDDLQVSIYSLG